MLIVASDNDEIGSFEDLDGKQTANTVSSTYAQTAESYGAANNGVDDFDQTISLLAAMNAAIGELRAEGTLTALPERYFGADISTSRSVGLPGAGHIVAWPAGPRARRPYLPAVPSALVSAMPARAASGSR